jgi:hypothetical protein
MTLNALYTWILLKQCTFFSFFSSDITYTESQFFVVLMILSWLQYDRVLYAALRRMSCENRLYEVVRDCVVESMNVSIVEWDKMIVETEGIENWTEMKEISSMTGKTSTLTLKMLKLRWFLIIK